MPTLVSRTIGSGGFYATPQLWNDAAPLDLVVADTLWEGRILAGNNFIAGGNVVTISGSVDSATCFKRLTVDAGGSFQDGVRPLFYDSATGVTIGTTSEYNGQEAIINQEPNATFSRLQITATNQASGVQSAQGKFDSCIFYATTNASNARFGTTVTTNCLFISTNTTPHIFGTGGSNLNITGSTFIKVGGGGSATNAGYSTSSFVNCAVYGSGSINASADSPLYAGSNNYTDMAAAPAGFTITTLAAAQFVNSANNLKLQSTSPLKEAGISIAGVVKDILGTTRPQGVSFDVGAHEFSGVVLTVPGAPTIGVATVNAQTAGITFTAPASDGGSAITGYTATSSPGGFTGTSAASPVSVSGLAISTIYTFTVKANNIVGASSASAASNAITSGAAATVPGAPTIGLLTNNANGTITIAGTAPASDGGAAITRYLATSSVGGVQAAAATLPIIIANVSLVSQTVTLRAENSAGMSLASAASNAVTATSIAGAGNIPPNLGAAGTVTLPVFKIGNEQPHANLVIASLLVQTMTGITVATFTNLTCNALGALAGQTHTNIIIGTVYRVVGADAGGNEFRNKVTAT